MPSRSFHSFTIWFLKTHLIRELTQKIYIQDNTIKLQVHSRHKEFMTKSNKVENRPTRDTTHT